MISELKERETFMYVKFWGNVCSRKFYDQMIKITYLELYGFVILNLFTFLKELYLRNFIRIRSNNGDYFVDEWFDMNAISKILIFCLCKTLK